VPTEIEKKKTRISRFVLSTLFFKRAAHSKISLIDDVTTEVTRRPHPRAKSEIGRDEKKKVSFNVHMQGDNQGMHDLSTCNIFSTHIVTDILGLRVIKTANTHRLRNMN
jgi:hypothetical protein